MDTGCTRGLCYLQVVYVAANKLRGQLEGRAQSTGEHLRECKRRLRAALGDDFTLVC